MTEIEQNPDTPAAQELRTWFEALPEEQKVSHRVTLARELNKSKIQGGSKKKRTLLNIP